VFDGHSLTVRGECPDAENDEPVPAEFREQIVALVRSGRSVEDLAREFDSGAASTSRPATTAGASRTASEPERLAVVSWT